MLLLLEALARCIEQQDKDFGDVTAHSLRRIMCNEDYSGSDKYKVLLSGDDQEAFIDLMTGKESKVKNQSKIKENFDFFLGKIKGLKNKDAKWFSKGLLGLRVVSILLDLKDDDPQHVFESMNSKGKPLSASDLARNFILMKRTRQEQEELHGKYWHHMEANLRFKEDDLLEPFLRDYLLYKKAGSLSKDTRLIYKEFQKRYKDSKCSEEQFLNDLLTHSASYASFIFPGKIQHAKLSRAFEDWRLFPREPSTPLMMALYACFRDECFDATEFCRIIRLIETFSFRRWVCGLPPNARSAVFMDLIDKINNRAEFKNGYFAGLVEYFLAQGDNRRFPVNEEFKDDLLGINMGGVYCRYVLDKLENYGRKEKIDLDSEDISIEHIMPQKLNAPWKKELGAEHKEVHLRFLNKIGNLTLTGHNSKLSNKPFLVKKEKGFKNSPLRLNEYVRQAEKWTKEEIEERGKLLAERAVEVWAMPEAE